MTVNQYRVPTAHDLAEDDWVTDNCRGRRKCPEHPQQDMIPMVRNDICPLDHGDTQTED